MILDITEVKAYLRVEDDEEDDIIEKLIMQAQDAIERFTRIDFSDGCPQSVKLAGLIFVSHYYQNRDVYDRVTYTTMLSAFENLLYPYRDVDRMF